MRHSITIFEDQYKLFKAFNSPELFIAFAEYMFEDIEPTNLNEQENAIFDSLRIRMDNLKKKSVAWSKSHWWGASLWNQNAKKNYETTTKQQQNNNKTTTKQQEEQEQEQVQDKEQETIKRENMCEINSHDCVSFDKFWNIYPNRKDKKKARIAFERLSLIKKQLAIEWIPKLKESEQRKKWFIPLPTTYLNWERREDEVENKKLWIEQLKERERKRIQEESRWLLFENKREHEKSVQTEWVDRRTSFESS